MANTITTQIRAAETIEGVEKFVITITVTDAGDLPTKAIFVMTLADPNDPKEDTFARVATIADLTELLEDRAAAVLAEETLYRVMSTRFIYDNLDTGVAAQDVLKSRIDELVIDWQTYSASFVTTSEVTTHPRVDPSAFEALVDAYTAALAAEATAKETRDSALTDYNTAQTDADDAATALTTAQTQRDQCYQFKSYFQTFYDSMKAGTGFYQDADTFRLAAETYRAATTGLNPAAESVFVAAQTTFGVKQSNANTALTNASANLALFAAECASKDTAVSTAQSTLATAQTTLAQKRTAYEDAQAAYAAAQAASDAALTAIKTLKPDYDPTA